MSSQKTGPKQELKKALRDLTDLTKQSHALLTEADKLPTRILAIAEAERFGVISAVKNSEGGNALHSAAAIDAGGVIASILNNVSSADRVKLLQQKDSRGYTAVSVAATKGNMKALNNLSEKLSDKEKFEIINLREVAVPILAHRNGKKIWKHLTDHLDKQTISEVLEHQDESSGRTSLHTAVADGKSEAVDLVLQHVDAQNLLDFVTKQDSNGGTVIHNAAQMGDLKSIEAIQKKIRTQDQLKLFSISDSSGKTALHVAAANGFTNIYKFILDSLAEDERLQLLKVRDSMGKTAEQYLSIEEHKDTKKHLPRLKTAIVSGKKTL